MENTGKYSKNTNTLSKDIYNIVIPKDLAHRVLLDFKPCLHYLTKLPQAGKKVR